jgi:GTP-binding protein
MAQPFPPLRFLRSAARSSDLPAARAEVAFVGRSNVGKSSLLNAVTGHRQLAKVSRTPGRTQLINVFDAGDGRWVVDLPGYGFASAPARVRSSWQAMIEGYLTTRPSLRMVFVLVDAEVGPTPLDHQMTEWLAACRVPYHIVANKADKVGKSRHGARHSAVAKQLGRALEDVSWVSAEKGTGVPELRKLVIGILAGG